MIMRIFGKGSAHETSILENVCMTMEKKKSTGGRGKLIKNGIYVKI